MRIRRHLRSLLDPHGHRRSLAPASDGLGPGATPGLRTIGLDEEEHPESGDARFEQLAEEVRSLSPSKQLRLVGGWPGVELRTPEGLTVFARSKKERLRFTRERSDEMDAWLKSFGAGDVFYDIGANCGSLTLAVAALHQGRVPSVAIEPGYGNFESLVRNLSSSGQLGSVIPLQVALNDTTSVQPMNYFRSTEAGTSLHAVGAAIDHEGRPFQPVEVQMVPAFRLDDLVETLRLPAPTRVKIDVDGFEESVIRGAERVLESGSVRELAIEIVDHDRAGSRPDAISAFLGQHGYELSRVFHHHGETSFVADYLFARVRQGRS